MLSKLRIKCFIPLVTNFCIMFLTAHDQHIENEEKKNMWIEFTIYNL